MREIIVSMGYKTKVNARYPGLYLSFDFNGTGQRDRENAPHAHIFGNGKRKAQISIDPPFNYLNGEENVSGRDKHLVLDFLRNNTSYVHFAWYLSTNHTNYDVELGLLSDATKEQYFTRFCKDNPNYKPR